MRYKVAYLNHHTVCSSVVEHVSSLHPICSLETITARPLRLFENMWSPAGLLSAGFMFKNWSWYLRVSFWGIWMASPSQRTCTIMWDFFLAIKSNLAKPLKTYNDFVQKSHWISHHVIFIYYCNLSNKECRWSSFCAYKRRIVLLNEPYFCHS